MLRKQHVATASASAQSNDLRRVGCHGAAAPHKNVFHTDSMRVLPSSCYIPLSAAFRDNFPWIATLAPCPEPQPRLKGGVHTLGLPRPKAAAQSSKSSVAVPHTPVCIGVRRRHASADYHIAGTRARRTLPGPMIGRRGAGSLDRLTSPALGERPPRGRDSSSACGPRTPPGWRWRARAPTLTLPPHPRPQAPDQQRRPAPPRAAPARRQRVRPLLGQVLGALDPQRRAHARRLERELWRLEQEPWPPPGLKPRAWSTGGTRCAAPACRPRRQRAPRCLALRTTLPQAQPQMSHCGMLNHALRMLVIWNCKSLRHAWAETHARKRVGQLLQT